MTGHAFQVLVTDEDLRASLATIWAALTDNGRFAFETRNPAAREWEEWTTRPPQEVTATSGASVQMATQVDSVEGDLVQFTHTFTSAAWDRQELSHSTLRFLDQDSLSSFLAEASLAIDEQYGDWTAPLAESSPEIITFARRS